jgi:hypothetical protein
MGQRTVRRLSLLVVLAVAMVGCQATREAEADPVEFALNQEFPLRGGQEAVISAENLRLRFTDVLEDSRCPTEVECFWTGQARIAVLVEPSGSPSTTVDFNTNPAVGQNIQAVDVDDYTISLKSLDPYPRTPDESIALEDYRATLSVQETSS